MLVGLNASIVRGKLEHLLGIEMQLQRTLNITEMDSGWTTLAYGLVKPISYAAVNWEEHRTNALLPCAAAAAFESAVRRD